MGLADYLKLLNIHLPTFTQGLLLVLCIPSISDSTLPNFGPNGEDCVRRSDIHKSYYDHTDVNGLRCSCQLCGPGNILIKDCTCDPSNLDRPQVSECGLVPRGQFMNSSNSCSQGFECKKCPYPLKVKKRCRRHGPDSVCTCVDGYYMALPDTCLPFPTCDAGYEPKQGHGDDRTEIRCTPCREGYFQPNNNNTLSCKKIRQCTVQEGNLRSDAVCLNDPTTQTKQQTNSYVTTETLTTTEYTKNYEPVTTPVPTPRSDEINNASGSTTPPTTNATDVVSIEWYPPLWIYFIHVPSYTFPGFLLGVLVSNLKSVLSFLRSCSLKKTWNYLRSSCQRGTHDLPEGPSH